MKEYTIKPCSNSYIYLYFLGLKLGVCTPLDRWSSSIYRMRLECSTRFNLTTTSVRWSVHKFPKLTKAQVANVKSSHRFFRYANLVRPPYVVELTSGAWDGARGYEERQLTGLVRLALSTSHLFAGPMLQASLTPGDLRSNPVAVADLRQL